MNTSIKIGDCVQITDKILSYSLAFPKSIKVGLKGTVVEIERKAGFNVLYILWNEFTSANTRWLDIWLNNGVLELYRDEDFWSSELVIEI